MEKSQYQKMYELEDRHWWFLAKRQFIKALLPAPPQNWQILDLGSGTGGTTQFLEVWGKVTGIESSTYAQKYLKGREVKYFPSTIETFKSKKESYDLACLFDVLYHRNVTDDEKVLKIAFDALKKNGLLLITDSALPFLYSRHDEIMHARERYYLGDLAQKVENAGFKIEKKSYIYFLLFPLFIISRLINKYLNYSSVTPVNPIINSLLLNLCKFEAFLLKYICFPIGSSIIIKARKP